MYYTSCIMSEQSRMTLELYQSHCSDTRTHITEWIMCSLIPGYLHVGVWGVRLFWYTNPIILISASIWDQMSILYSVQCTYCTVYICVCRFLECESYEQGTHNCKFSEQHKKACNCHHKLGDIVVTGYYRFVLKTFEKVMSPTGLPPCNEQRSSVQ